MDENSVGRLTGKIALVTGGSSGVGSASVFELRHALSGLLRESQKGHIAQLSEAPHDVASVELLLPVKEAGYANCFSSIHHASNAERSFRPDAPLLPYYKYVPIGYNGRASSVQVSGACMQRPWRQLKTPDAAAPVFQDDTAFAKQRKQIFEACAFFHP